MPKPVTVKRRPNYAGAAGPREGILKAADLLLNAKRPVLFVGNGVLLSDATCQLKEFAELTGVPVATTLMGKGAFPEKHPLALGTTGIWGTSVANETAREADVIVAIGTGFGEADCSSWNPKYTFAIPPSKLIQIDCDPQEIGKIYPVEVGIVGDAKETLRQMIEVVKADGRRVEPCPCRTPKVEERKQTWKEQLVASQADGSKPIHPARLLFELSQVLDENTIIVTDVGWNKNGAAQQLQVNKPRYFHHVRRVGDDGIRSGGGDWREDRGAGSQSGVPRRRWRTCFR